MADERTLAIVRLKSETPDAPSGEGATLAVTGGGPAAFDLSGERTLLSIVDADPSVRGLASTGNFWIRALT